MVSVKSLLLAGMGLTAVLATPLASEPMNRGPSPSEAATHTVHRGPLPSEVVPEAPEGAVAGNSDLETVDSNLDTRAPWAGNPMNQVNCGGTYYTAAAISSALTYACGLWTQWDYNYGFPHNFYNRESLDFGSVPSGPYGEYPIVGGGNWQSGNPGPDRIVFDVNCNYIGVITHTSATYYNYFVGCT